MISPSLPSYDLEWVSLSNSLLSNFLLNLYLPRRFGSFLYLAMNSSWFNFKQVFELLNSLHYAPKQSPSFWIMQHHYKYGKDSKYFFIPFRIQTTTCQRTFTCICLLWIEKAPSSFPSSCFSTNWALIIHTKCTRFFTCTSRTSHWFKLRGSSFSI